MDEVGDGTGALEGGGAGAVGSLDGVAAGGALAETTTTGGGGLVFVA